MHERDRVSRLATNDRITGRNVESRKTSKNGLTLAPIHSLRHRRVESRESRECGRDVAPLFQILKYLLVGGL
jgi:hypothetical protein